MKGWSALHPFQEERLRALGLNGNQITQGVATNSGDMNHPSRGSHDAVGAKAGREFGHCIDLSVSYTPNRAHFDALVKAGFCPFYRDWSGNQHWHVVDVAWIRNDAGLAPRHLAIPREQVLSFLKVPPRDGLVSDLPLSAAWRPSAAQQAYLRKLWETGALPDGYGTVDPTVKVVGLSGEVVDCHPEVVNGKARGDVAAVAEALGCEAIWKQTAQGPRVYLKLKGA